MSFPLWDYPPLPYLEQVLKNCHKAAGLYMDLWKRRDKENKVYMNKATMKTDFLIPTASINSNLLKLSVEGVISIKDTPRQLIVELVGWDEEFDD